MITREVYLQKLRQLKDTDLIKVITGVRRCGKSTIIQMFRNELVTSGVAFENIVFYNFEERDNTNLGS